MSFVESHSTGCMRREERGREGRVTGSIEEEREK
jgi:hypothetical protein